MSVNIRLGFACFSALVTMFPALALAGDNIRYGGKTFEPFLTRGETTFAVNVGLRNNKTSLAEASDLTGTTTPNIRLENTFRDVSFLELGGKIRHVEPANIGFIKGGLLTEMSITGGYIIDGFTQRSGYAGDGRTAETFRQSTNDLKGDAIGGAISLGYKFDLTGTPGQEARQLLTRAPKSARDRRKRERALQKALNSPGPYVSLTPFIGYGIDQQTYSIDNIFQIIPTVTSFSAKADYVTNWYGPFFGVEGEIKNDKHMLRLRGQYHDLSYDGEFEDVGSGNLYEYDADAEGITLSAEYAYAVSNNYAFTLEGFYQTRQTDEGTSVRSNNGVNTGNFLLYEFDDESNALRLGLRYNWD